MVLILAADATRVGESVKVELVIPRPHISAGGTSRGERRGEFHGVVLARIGFRHHGSRRMGRMTMLWQEFARRLAEASPRPTAGASIVMRGLPGVTGPRHRWSGQFGRSTLCSLPCSWPGSTLGQPARSPASAAGALRQLCASAFRSYEVVVCNT